MESSSADVIAPPDPTAVSGTLRRYEQAVAETVTDAFLAGHPDWVARYGDRARQAGVEDARFHVQFLSAAIESNSPLAFRDYVHWAARVLGARGIDSVFLWENLDQLQHAAGHYLAETDRQLIDDFMKFAKAPESHVAPAMIPEGPLSLTRRMFVQAIVTGDRKVALTIAREALRNGAGVQDLYADVFQDGLYAVGRLWETNAITVAQEHMATAITQYVMAHVFGTVESAVAQRGVAVMTGVPGELHQVGALMVSDMLEAHGWRVQFLGSHLPIPSILSAIVDAKPQLLGISVTMPFNLHHAARLIGEARRAVPQMRVVVGGAAFRIGEWRDIGANDYATDVRSAIALLCGETAV
jgi:methanogenic corrinoid protein MtbC1